MEDIKEKDELNIESTPPDDEDVKWRQEHIRKEMLDAFCRSLFSERCCSGCDSCC